MLLPQVPPPVPAEVRPAQDCSGDQIKDMSTKCYKTIGFQLLEAPREKHRDGYTASGTYTFGAAVVSGEIPCCDADVDG